MPSILDELMLNVGPAALSNPQFLARQNALASGRAPVAPQGPADAPQPVSGPQQQPMQQRAPQGGGGGIGGIVSGIGSMLMPNASRRNQTVQWLQGQGLDEGTATLLAGNKPALQKYLLDRSQGADPKDALELEKLGLEVEQMRKPTTDDIKEYQFARNQGYQGTLPEFMQEMRKAGASSVTVGGGKYGTIPQGYQLVEGPEGARMEPIPGGPAAAEQEAAAQAEQKRRQGEVERGDLVAEEIDRALNVMDSGALPDTGFGAFLSGVPGTDAKSLASRLDTIRANIGFEELNKMRQQSPTGGALGQVTERELAFLQAVAGSLDQAQSAEDLRYNLNRLWNSYMDVIHGPGQGPERRPLGTPSEREVLDQQYRDTGRPQRFRYNPETGELE